MEEPFQAFLRLLLGYPSPLQVGFPVSGLRVSPAQYEAGMSGLTGSSCATGCSSLPGRSPPLLMEHQHSGAVSQVPASVATPWAPSHNYPWLAVPPEGLGQDPQTSLHGPMEHSSLQGDLFSSGIL